MTFDIAHLRDWIGTTETAEERIAAFPSNALAATLDRGDAPYVEGSALPPLWHWMHFLAAAPQAHIGPDGHPSRGGFLPPVPLPRRMWAGSRLRFKGPILIGDIARKVSTVKDVTYKSGRSGDLVFVTVQHEYFSGYTCLLEEEHDIVYRAAPAPADETPQPPAAPETSAFGRVVIPDPVLLFRYSALTFNGHRIHYDQPYAAGVEGYPGLIVHGPLIATLLIDLLRREMPDAAVAVFRFRTLSPLFDTADFSIHGQPEGDGVVRLWARRADGGLAMDATATLKGE